MNSKDFSAQMKVYYWRYMKLPTYEEFIEEFQVELEQETFDKWCSSDGFRKFCETNDIVDNKIVTLEQIRCIEAVLDTEIPNFLDKFKMAGVSPAKFRAWQKQPAFMKLLTERTNALAVEERHKIWTTLTKSAEKGDMRAVRLFFELNDEMPKPPPRVINTPVAAAHNPFGNTREIVMKLVEVIQRHTDPVTLAKITADFERVMLGTPTEASTSPGVDIFNLLEIEA